MQIHRNRRKLRELRSALRPYRKFWQEWIISPACFLTRREIDTILLFQKHRSIFITAASLEISQGRVYEILNRAINRLKWNAKYYGHWVADKMIDNAGAYDRLSERDKFLNTPLFYHKLPPKLYFCLSQHGESMGEILEKFDERELLFLKGFGKKKLLCLKKLLKKNECLDLLRKPKRKEIQAEMIIELVRKR